MSESEKKVKSRKLLPEIPAGVKPAASPLTARAVRAAISNTPTHSPMLPRELNRSQPRKEVVTAMAGIPLSTKDGENSAVRVAVRVRPFSTRLVIPMCIPIFGDCNLLVVQGEGHECNSSGEYGWKQNKYHILYWQSPHVYL